VPVVTLVGTSQKYIHSFEDEPGDINVEVTSPAIEISGVLAICLEKIVVIVTEPVVIILSSSLLTMETVMIAGHVPQTGLLSSASTSFVVKSTGSVGMFPTHHSEMS